MSYLHASLAASQSILTIVGAERAAAACLAELLEQDKVHAGGLLGAVGAGACHPDPHVGLNS